MKKGIKSLSKNLIALSAAAVGLGADAIANLSNNNNHSLLPNTGITAHADEVASVVVPNYAGSTLYTFQNWATVNKVNLVVTYVSSNTVAKNTILENETNNVATNGTINVVVSAGPEASDTSTTYTVQQGETVWRISKNTGVDIQTIEKANNIDSSTHLVYAGSTLVIPRNTDTAATVTTEDSTASVVQAETSATDTNVTNTATPVQDTNTEVVTTNDNTQVVEDNTASSTPVVSDSNTNSAQDTASSVVDNSSAT
ncbi:MAG: LysM peptidoglycan-binding domain-containing protein, partial [Lactobacillaceae bacterium]|nr:LysM peptidoglycan-binding domain-containing protein [Lactobacillaceae bacterium]